jgi:hypothetical protein
MKNSEIFSKHIDPYDTIVQLVEHAKNTNEELNKINATLMMYDHRITAIEAVIADIIKRNELNR